MSISNFKGVHVKRSLLFAVALVLCAIVSYAQLTRGAVLGSVLDPSGAAISGATVSIINNATKAERSTTSNGEGIYRFDGVDPGVYTVVFSATGFTESRVNEVSVRTSQEVTINHRLALGTATATVDVTDNPPGVELDKTTATIQRTLPQAFISCGERASPEYGALPRIGRIPAVPGSQRT